MPDGPEAAAAALLAGRGTAIPVPVEVIAAARGVTVARNHAEGNDCAGFVYRQGSRRIIGVNTAISPRRQRFQVARGFGHLLLHPKRDLIVWHHIQLGEPAGAVATAVEADEANRFAGALLMPREQLVVALAGELEAGHDSRDALIGALARRFQVSTEAMGWRLIALNLTMA